MKPGWEGLKTVTPTEEQKLEASKKANSDNIFLLQFFSGPDGKKALEIFRKWAQDPGFMPSAETCRDGHMMSLLQNIRIGEYNFYRRIVKAIEKGKKAK